MTRLPTLCLAFATGFLTALTGAWWTLEIIVKFLYRKGKIG